MNENQTLTIKTEDLTKKYGDLTAVESLNLSISKGEIFGLLGPNGSGKTTIILMLLGLTEPTSGGLNVLGFDPVKQPFEVKRMVGYLPEKVGFYETLSAEQNLRFFGRLNRIEEDIITKRIDEALTQVGLSSRKKGKVNTFSRGMKQRLGIANVLIKDPKMIILDEPTQGIDPKGIQEILDLFQSINKEKNITIMLSSHLIHHVEQICDNIGIMSDGVMRVRGSVNLNELNVDEEWLIEFSSNDITSSIFEKIENMNEVRSIEADGMLYKANCSADIRPKIVKTIIQNGGSLLTLALQERNLISIYKEYSEEK
jgi:ABC-2 type transport system ATP-binding protein